MKKYSIIRLLASLLGIVLLSGCARFSVWQKSAVIVGTAGAASTAVLYSNYASAGASLASGAGVGLVGSTTSMIVDATEATHEQINAAEAAAKRFEAALTAAARQERKKQGKRYIALKVPATVKTRGQGSVMIYDTEKHRLASVKAYTLRRLPDPGKVFRFDMGDVEYLGVIPAIGLTPGGTKPSSTADTLAVKPVP